MNMEESKEFAKRIALVRENAGMNKQEFARLLSISPAYVTYIESGEKNGAPLNPTKSLLFMISHKLGVNIEWLKTGKGSMFSGFRSQVTARLNNLSNSQLESVLKFIDNLEGKDPEDPPTRRRHSTAEDRGLRLR